MVWGMPQPKVECKKNEGEDQPTAENLEGYRSGQYAVQRKRQKKEIDATTQLRKISPIKSCENMYNHVINPTQRKHVQNK